jgi:hypothetical protein
VAVFQALKQLLLETDKRENQGLPKVKKIKRMRRRRQQFGLMR